jgi:chromosomal replication initiator protein
VTDAERVWKDCLSALRGLVSEAAWMTTFEDVRAGIGGTSELVLLVPNSLVKERLESRFLSMVRDVVDDAGGSELSLRVEVVSSDQHAGIDAAGGLSDGDDADDAEEVPLQAVRTGRRRRDPADGAALNPEYTFDAFVIGEANRFAHAAARSAAESPASSYNPLFIHGASGLGKTHLLHAIGHYVHEQYPDFVVQYVSTETFLNEYIDMIRNGTGPDFRRRYRQVDVLLIDDVQFLAGKEGLQEEFFHTFDHLYRSKSQIVLTSDTPPGSIPTLEERLKNRFQWGLVSDVQPPNLETRLAILRKKSEGEVVGPPEEVLALIATNVRSNIRELEGALTRVIAFASLEKAPLDLAMAERVLSDILSASEPRRITPRLILATAASQFMFSVDELCGPTRKRPLVEARQIAMYVMRELTELSYPSIGDEFGGRDHTTVLHAVNKIGREMKEKRAVYEQVTALRSALVSGA